MKAYGLRSKLMLNLTDFHLPKGWMNRLEAEWNTVKSKKSAR